MPRRHAGALAVAVVFLASWLSVMAAALACSLELALSGTVPLGVIVPAMMGWHALIGIGEGLITTVAVAFVARAWGLEQLGQKGFTAGERKLLFDQGWARFGAAY